MEYIVLGTAGHIDHGKTSLVKTLTGIDTDRLKEEKERGITIDLGFAYLPLPSGITLSIVDVPGHERFVKNMVAGAAGIDMVILVIAADDGIMPQTKEHLDICSILGIRHGLVAITKSDLVDSNQLLATIGEVKEFLKGGFLEGAPILPVSSVTGRGVNELVSAIDSIAKLVVRKKEEGAFRMPIDRAFTIKGFGTVITGTVVSGSVKVGDEIEILPKGIRARVRGMQTHGNPVNEGIAGSRTAINLQGIEKQEIKRGDVAITPGRFETANIIEAAISILPSAPRLLKDGTEGTFHIFTTATQGAIMLLEAKEIRPGEKCFARIALKEPVVAIHGDRFVLRLSDARTVGGGIVFDVNPPRRKRAEAIEELKALASDNEKARALLYIKRAGIKGIDVETLLVRVPSSLPLQSIISELVFSNEVIDIEGVLISSEVVRGLKESIIALLSVFHKKETMKSGMQREELRTRLRVPQKILGIILNDLIKGKVVSVDGETLRLASHKVSGGEIKVKIEEIYRGASLHPPTTSELLEMLKIKEREALDILNLLVKERKLVKVKELFFSKGAIDGLVQKVIDFYKRKKEMTTQEFKELTGVSRKFAIPLAEYLDQQKITIRVGEIRRLRK